MSSHRLHELDKLTSNYIFINQGNLIPFDRATGLKHCLRVRIQIEPNDISFVKQILTEQKVKFAQNQLVIGIDDFSQIPDIVYKLAKNKIRIRSVMPENESIEDSFLKLCNKKDYENDCH